MSSPCFFFVYMSELSPAACRCSCACGNYQDCDLVAVLVTPLTLLLVLFFLCGYYKHLATRETELTPSFHSFKKISLTWWPSVIRKTGAARTWICCSCRAGVGTRGCSAAAAACAGLGLGACPATRTTQALFPKRGRNGMTEEKHKADHLFCTVFS